MLSRSHLGEGYSFRYIKKRPSVKGGLLICTHTYRFKTRLNRVYLVDVEQYQNDIFIVKFYLKSHQNSKKRFNLTTKTTDAKGEVHYDGDGWRILSTCLRIMREMREKHPRMSGGFIGAEREGESKALTKRYKIWSQAALTFFDPEHYNHYSNADASAYFIEFKGSPVPNLVNEAAKMFEELYRDTEGLFPDASVSQAG